MTQKAKPIRAYENNTYHISLMKRLVLSIIMFVMLPVLLFVAYFSVRTILDSRREIQANAESIFLQTWETLNNKIGFISTTSYYFIANSDLVSIADTDPDKVSIRAQIQAAENMSLNLPTANNTSEIHDTYIYTRYRYPILTSSSHFGSFEDIEDEPWFQQSLIERSFLSFSGADPLGEYPDMLSVIRKIPSSSNYTVFSSVVRFLFSKTEFDLLLGGATCTENSLSLIVDESGAVIAGSSPGVPEIIDSSMFHTAGTDTTIWDHKRSSDGAWQIGIRKLKLPDWYLVMIIPQNEINNYGGSMIIQFFILAVIIIISVLIYMTYTSRTLISRIRNLTMSMRIQDGMLRGQMIVNHSTDEIGILIDDYNYLISKNNKMMQDLEQYQDERRQSELTILRSQMNPHFLYNTLEMIRWYAGIGDKTQVDHIISALSKFYRLSLNRGKEFYLVSDELKLLNAYFDIMNLRYEQNISFYTDIADEILSCTVPVVFLQPLLENSINHGILKKNERKGTVMLTGKQVSGNLVFVIEDDGVGMSEEMLQMLNSGTYKPSDSSDYHGSGIGVTNIQERIHLLYGFEYGLNYTKGSVGGTIVTVTIPANH